MSYKIGDRVIVRDWESMPETFRVNKDGASMTARGKCCGKHATVCDVLESVTDGTLYKIKTDEGLVSSVLYRGDWLIQEPKRNIKFFCRYEADTDKLYVSVDDGNGISESAYGYVQSDDLAGYVSAFSFAAFTLNNKFKNKKENNK